jgi:spore maturation protein SpmA
MMNAVWLALILVSFVTAAFTGQMGAVTNALIHWSGKSVMLAIGLIGMMAFWLGVMRVVRDAGMLRLLARALRPIMTRLFPGIPAEHPAMSAMILNIGANMLGLTNAATPFGIKATEELNRLNPAKGTATNAMCLFLAINTSAVALFPSGVIAIRAAVGSEEPAGIILTTLMATSISTLVAIAAAKTLERLPRFRATDPGSLRVAPGDADLDAEAAGADLEAAEAMEAAAARRGARTLLQRAAVAATIAAVAVGVVVGVVWRGHHPEEAASFAVRAIEPPRDAVKELGRRLGVVEGTVGELGRRLDGAPAETPSPEPTTERAPKGLPERLGDLASAWFLPLLLVALVLFAWARGVRVYESLVEGAKEGFQVALRIIPYLVAILVAVGMLQASGALGLLISLISPITSTFGMPAEVLPSALLRPLSGSGSFGVMTHALESYGPDGYIGYLVSTVQGSTETTFYVLAVYFGAVGIRRVRHALPACLLADVAGIAGAILAVKLLTSF